MAWLSRLDARAKQWRFFVRWPYWCLRTLLLLVGLFLAFGLAYQELSEKRVGLGTGLTLALIFAGVRGLFIAIEQARSSAPSPPRPND